MMHTDASLSAAFKCSATRRMLSCSAASPSCPLPVQAQHILTSLGAATSPGAPIVADVRQAAATATAAGVGYGVKAGVAEVIQWQTWVAGEAAPQQLIR